LVVQGDGRRREAGDAFVGEMARLPRRIDGWTELVGGELHDEMPVRV